LKVLRFNTETEDILQLGKKLSTEIHTFFTKEQIQKIARESEFVKRDSKLKAWMYLETLVFSKFNQKKLSLNEISNDFYSNYSLEITKQGVDERFNEKSVTFLKNCVSELLKNHFTNNTSILGFAQFSRVRIKDSTKFQLPENMKHTHPGTGGSASDAAARIQYEFDLKNGDVIDFDITAGNINDFTDAKLKEDDIRKGDLLLRDLGYISVDSIKNCNDKEAFHISRLKAQTGIYILGPEKKQGISLKEIQSKLLESKEQFIEMTVCIGDRKYIPVRLVAAMLPEEKIKERIIKMRRKQVTAGRKFKEEFCQTAGLNVFITNIPKEIMSAPDIYNTYKLRWQIELVFKIWKSIGEIHLIKDVKPERLLTLLYAKLLWLLVNWGIINEISNQLFNSTRERLSPYKSTITLMNCMDKIRSCLRNVNDMISILKKIISTMIKHNKSEKRKNHISSLELLV